RLIVEQSGAVGPFTTWNRYLTGYKGTPEGVVEYASVYVVSKENRQEKYEVAVNSKDLKSPCFSVVEASSGSSVDQKVLDDINDICKNNGFHIHKTHEFPLPVGDYFGALDPEHSLELNFNRGIPVNASLSGIKGDTLNFMSCGHLFVYAHVEGSDHVELVLPSRGVDASSIFGEGRVGRGNMKVWDNERKRRKRRKFCICHYFKPKKFRGTAVKLFDRISRNYVELLDDIHPNRRDFFFERFYDAVAQSVLYGMFLAFPKSRMSFLDEFRKSIVSLFAFWTTGVVSEYPDTSHWKLNLGGGDVLVMMAKDTALTSDQLKKEENAQAFKTFKEKRRLEARRKDIMEANVSEYSNYLVSLNTMQEEGANSNLEPDQD
ncbi:hypothetical protein FOL46_005737, partial [Perkinsus olseni]